MPNSHALFLSLEYANYTNFLNSPARFDFSFAKIYSLFFLEGVSSGSGKNMSFKFYPRALFSIYCFKNQGFICHRRLLAQSNILQSLI